MLFPFVEEYYEEARKVADRAPQEVRRDLRILVGDCAILVSDLHRLNDYLDPQDRGLLRKGMSALLAELSEFALSGTGLTHPEAGPIVARRLASVVEEMDGGTAEEQPASAIDAAVRILKGAQSR
jgi:hypothetical protein